MILSHPSVGPHYHDSSCFCKLVSALCSYQALLGKHRGQVRNKTALKLEDGDSSLQVSNALNSWFLPILMAVSCLSPVRIQILMSAFIRVSMVSGTLSWSLSSMAVAPSSCRFCTRKQGKDRKKKKVSKWWSNQRKAFKTSCARETCKPGSCHSFTLVFPLISCPCLSPRKTTMGFRGIGYVTTSVCLRVCVCVHGRTSADKTSHTQAQPQNTVGVFPRKLGGSLGLVAGSYGATTGPEIWRDPGVAGRQGPAAEERQRKLSWALLLIHL